jgi:cytochrome c biogenesis protein ResB
MTIIEATIKGWFRGNVIGAPYAIPIATYYGSYWFAIMMVFLFVGSCFCLTSYFWEDDNE